MLLPLGKGEVPWQESLLHAIVNARSEIYTLHLGHFHPETSP